MNLTSFMPEPLQTAVKVATAAGALAFGGNADAQQGPPLLPQAAESTLVIPEFSTGEVPPPSLTEDAPATPMRDNGTLLGIHAPHAGAIRQPSEAKALENTDLYFDRQNVTGSYSRLAEAIEKQLGGNINPPSGALRNTLDRIYVAIGSKSNAMRKPLTLNQPRADNVGIAGQIADWSFELHNSREANSARHDQRLQDLEDNRAAGVVQSYTDVESLEEAWADIAGAWGMAQPATTVEMPSLAIPDDENLGPWTKVLPREKASEVLPQLERAPVPTIEDPSPTAAAPDLFLPPISPPIFEESEPTNKAIHPESKLFVPSKVKA